MNDYKVIPKTKHVYNMTDLPKPQELSYKKRDKLPYAFWKERNSTLRATKSPQKQSNFWKV